MRFASLGDFLRVMGPRRLTQEREQWASGCNFLATAPGTIVSYARNEETLRQLERAGFAVDVPWRRSPFAVIVGFVIPAILRHTAPR